MAVRKIILHSKRQVLLAKRDVEVTKGLTFHKQTRLYYTSVLIAVVQERDFASDIEVRHESDVKFFNFLC